MYSNWTKSTFVQTFGACHFTLYCDFQVVIAVKKSSTWFIYTEHYMYFQAKLCVQMCCFNVILKSCPKFSSIISVRQVSSALIINCQPLFSDLIAYLKEATSSWNQAFEFSMTSDMWLHGFDVFSTMHVSYYLEDTQSELLQDVSGLHNLICTGSEQSFYKAMLCFMLWF